MGHEKWRISKSTRRIPSTRKIIYRISNFTHLVPRYDSLTVMNFEIYSLNTIVLKK